MRRLEFLRSLEVSILSQRRGAYLPYGMAGGQSGMAGRNVWRHANGAEENLPVIGQFTAQIGDQLIIETPGGGGWGKPE